MEEVNILRVISATDAALLLTTGAVVCARFDCIPAAARGARADVPIPAQASLGPYNVALRMFLQSRLEVDAPPPQPPKTTQFKRVLLDD